MYKIITPSMIENSKRVLSMPADGSKANKQARTRAANILRSHAANLQKWLDLNPDSPIASSVRLMIDNCNNLFGWSA